MDFRYEMGIVALSMPAEPMEQLGELGEELLHVDATVLRRVGLEIPSGRAGKCQRTRQVATRPMVERHRSLNQALIKIFRSIGRMKPDLLQDFVTGKKLVVVEQRNPFAQPWINRSGLHDETFRSR